MLSLKHENQDREREREKHLFSLIINYKVLGLNTAGVAEGNAEGEAGGEAGGEAEGEALLPQRLCTNSSATYPRYLCTAVCISRRVIPRTS